MKLGIEAWKRVGFGKTYGQVNILGVKYFSETFS